MSVVRKLFYSTVNHIFKPNVTIESRSIIFKYPGPFFNESCPYYVTLTPGEYKIECWGGSSSRLGSNIGYGGYATGTLTLQESRNLYIYLGGSTYEMFVDYGSYNGGGKGDKPGAGATDVRLVGGEWDDELSLRSRIIVAGGGGGCDTPESIGGGYGGGLYGTDGHVEVWSGRGGSQIAGGRGYVNGSFGKGGSYEITYQNGVRNDHGGGGGGGYYGGGTGMRSNHSDGGGGSSFISGHDGCIAIDENGNPTTSSIHYSGISFTDTNTITGGEIMPLPNGQNDFGYHGSGVVKISSNDLLDCIYTFFPTNQIKFHKNLRHMFKIRG